MRHESRGWKEWGYSLYSHIWIYAQQNREGLIMTAMVMVSATVQMVTTSITYFFLNPLCMPLTMNTFPGDAPHPDLQPGMFYTAVLFYWKQSEGLLLPITLTDHPSQILYSSTSPVFHIVDF